MPSRSAERPFWLELYDPVRDKPRRSGQGRIARTASPSLGSRSPHVLSQGLALACGQPGWPVDRTAVAVGSRNPPKRLRGAQCRP